MLEMYCFGSHKFSSSTTLLRQFMLEHFPTLTNVSTNARVSISGTIWNSGTFTSNPMIVNTSGANEIVVLYDESAHFLVVQADNNVTGTSDIVSRFANRVLGDFIYMENEDGEPICITPQSSNKSPEREPFCVYYNSSGTSSGAYAHDFMNIPCTKAYVYQDYSKEYVLTPLYVGLCKMKNLFVCQNNMAKIGRRIKFEQEGKTKEFVCIGRQIFYEV